jgi:hypothetical protein
VSYRKARIFLYFQSVVSEDVETQKHGLVLIFAAGEEIHEQFVGEYRDDFVNIVKNPPYRVAVCHQSLPDGPKYQILNALWFLVLASKDERVRTKFHRDLSLLETQYKLLTYGIPVHLIPRTHSGNIKVKNHSQWINNRIAIDQIRDTSIDVTNLDCSIISHPGRHDVFFSNRSNMSNPGNVEFLEDVKARLDIFLSNPDLDSRQKILDEIVACVETRDGRFLQLQKGGWWEELPPDEVHEKIENYIHNCHRRLGVKVHQKSITSDTSAFLPSNKRQKVGDDGRNCGCSFF